MNFAAIPAIVVRHATEDDLEALARVWHDAWHDAHTHLVPPDLVAVRTLENFRERLPAALPNVRVAGPPTAPAGFHVVDGALLDHLYVTAAMRGTGVAAALLADAEEQISNHGFDVAWLTCAVGNDRAARFYGKHGWRRVRTTVEQAPAPAGTIPVNVWRYEKHLARVEVR